MRKTKEKFSYQIKDNEIKLSLSRENLIQIDCIEDYINGKDVIGARVDLYMYETELLSDIFYKLKRVVLEGIDIPVSFGAGTSSGITLFLA